MGRENAYGAAMSDQDALAHPNEGAGYFVVERPVFVSGAVSKLANHLCGFKVHCHVL